MFGEIYLYHLFCFPVVVCLNLSVNYDVCAGVRERRVKKLQIVSPQAGAEPLHPAAGLGHLRHGREGRVVQVRVLRASSVVSSTSIHFLTAGEDGS